MAPLLFIICHCPPFIICQLLSQYCWQPAPAIHPMSSGSWGWGWVLKLVLHSVVAVSGSVTCNDIVMVEPRNKMNISYFQKKNKESLPGPKWFIWACSVCDMALLPLHGLFPSGFWVGRWVSCSGWVWSSSGGGSGIVGCCVMTSIVKKSGTTWCMRMSKHMQMVCAHLGIFKQLTFQLFQLGCAPHIVVRYCNVKYLVYLKLWTVSLVRDWL